MAVETTRADEASAHRIPSLDGLRALSIFLVLALHSILGRSQLEANGVITICILRRRVPFCVLY
jgi:peptidoglycan/LPS O-acetylase OafA/YrhL